MRVYNYNLCNCRSVKIGYFLCKISPQCKYSLTSIFCEIYIRVSPLSILFQISITNCFWQDFFPPGYTCVENNPPRNTGMISSNVRDKKTKIELKLK